ncbi:MAG: signal peptidase II [Candidatus Hydrogenedentota bacterium]
MKHKYYYHLVFLITVILIMSLDQLTKRVAENTLFFNESFEILGNYIRLSYVENTGAAFGILKDKKIILISISIIAVIWIIWYYLKTTEIDIVEMGAMAIIIGGALGNLYDRIFRGYVVDFFDVGINSYRWPAFNIADISISLSICIWIVYSVYKDIKKKQSHSVS